VKSGGCHAPPLAPVVVALTISLCASAEAGAASYSLQVGSDGEVSAAGR
jgi:hypothetical protein